MWTPIEVSDFDSAASFYGTALGLPLLSSWRGDGERGAVFAVGASGRIEIVQTRNPAQPPPVALELPTWAAVDELAGRFGATPVVFPRGHYGFVTQDPDGNSLLMWSES